MVGRRIVGTEYHPRTLPRHHHSPVSIEMPTISKPFTPHRETEDTASPSDMGYTTSPTSSGEQPDLAVTQRDDLATRVAQKSASSSTRKANVLDRPATRGSYTRPWALLLALAHIDTHLPDALSVTRTRARLYVRPGYYQRAIQGF